jgi:hypothetical protein
MRHIKEFEKMTDTDPEQDEIYSSATSYLEEDQPISNEDGFSYCLYSFSGYNGTAGTIVSYYFKDYLSEDKLEIFYKYLKKNRFKIESENFTWSKLEINILLSYYRAKKFAELYDTIKKYNL